MGTNYYLIEQPPCIRCGREYEARHIGKSSAGWVFALRIYPDEGINTLEDWKPLLEKGVIKNEYDEVIPFNVMLDAITMRSFPNFKAVEGRTAEFYQANHAEPGPAGLVRSKTFMRKDLVV